MNILAFDTCMTACSAAVSRKVNGTWRLAGVEKILDRGHAEAIMPMVMTVMEEAGLAFSELDRIAVTIGPGSFSGVRIGVAAARGIALASGAPLVGLTSLAVMAAQARGEFEIGRHAHFSIAHDARRGQVYFGLFDEDGRSPVAAELLSPEMASARLGDGAAVAGSGAALVATAHPEHGLRAVLPALLPNARALAQLALAATVSQEPVRPLYLRPPDAKPQSGNSVPRRA